MSNSDQRPETTFHSISINVPLYQHRDAVRETRGIRVWPHSVVSDIVITLGFEETNTSLTDCTPEYDYKHRSAGPDAQITDLATYFNDGISHVSTNIGIRTRLWRIVLRRYNPGRYFKGEPE